MNKRIKKIVCFKCGKVIEDKEGEGVVIKTLCEECIKEDNKDCEDGEGDGDFEDWKSKKRAKVFVEHIQEHLEEDEKVKCKICDKTIDEIWEEFLEEKKREEE